MVSLTSHLKNRLSFLRYLEHQILERVSLRGAVIDLGAKSDDECYFSYIDTSQVASIDFCDIVSSSENVQKINLEKPFPIDSDTYDAVIHFNVLEHIYDYKNVIDESFRILRSGGESHCIIPFLWNYHGVPDDFNRFTHTALYRKFTDSGFSNVEVTPIGGGFWLLIASLFSKKVPRWWFQFLVISFFSFIDRLEQAARGPQRTYALAYYVRAVRC